MYSKWCEVSYAWLEKMARQHGPEATGLHKVEAIDVSAEGEPLTVRPWPSKGSGSSTN